MAPNRSRTPCNEFAGMNTSQYGSAAAIEPASGANPGAAARGFSQIR